MSIKYDSRRGKEIAKHLWDCFSTIGIFGKTKMPEDILPKNVEEGSLEHIYFITLTVSIDYQRDAFPLWDSARKTFEDPETRYLFDPKALKETPFDKIVNDMKKYKLSKRPRKDPDIWKRVALTFYEKWGGDPRNFLKDCNYDAVTILKKLKEYDFPFLRGDKIGPLWVRMLRDNVGITLKNLDQVPIPIDIHVLRATLTTGVVRGRFSGKKERLYEDVKMLGLKVFKD